MPVNLPPWLAHRPLGRTPLRLVKIQRHKTAFASVFRRAVTLFHKISFLEIDKNLFKKSGDAILKA